MSTYEKLEELGIDLKGKRSGTIKTTCPECSESRRNKKDLCLSVDIDGGLLYCHHCGKRGKVSDQLGRVENIAPPPRQEKLSERALKFFEIDRKISNDTLLRFGITESEEAMPPDFKKVKTINFNFFRNGEIINVKYRTKGKAFKMRKGSEMIPYNIDSILGDSECVVTEGEIDCLSLHDSGIYNCVSVPNGAKSKLECFDRCPEYFSDKTKIVLATDADEPGRALKKSLIEKFGKHRCYEVDFPEECNDPNDVLVKHGKAVLKRIIEEARPVFIASSDEIPKQKAKPGKAEETPFPLSVFPHPVLQFIKAQPQIQEDYLAAAILSALATAIGNTVFLEVMDGYIVKPILYMALVGPPGSSKSPAMKRAYELLEKHDSKQYKDFQERTAAHQAECELIENNKDKPPKPQFTQLLIKDSTIEMLVKILSFNPHGCGLIADELAGLLNRFNQYKSGDELQKWLEMWSGLSILLQRIGREENKIDNPFCGIIGGIQPAVLESLSKDEKEHNGFYHRFLFVYPTPQPKTDWKQIIVPDDIKEAYAEIFDVLLKWRQLVETTSYRLDTEANATYSTWFNGQNIKYNRAISDQVKGITAKYQDYCLRFALIIQVITDGMNRPAVGIIRKDAMEKAIALTEYFLVNMTKAIRILAPETPADKLQDPYDKLYAMLPEIFAAKLAISEGDSLGIPEGTVKTFLKRNTNVLFDNPERGQYVKIY